MACLLFASLLQAQTEVDTHIQLALQGETGKAASGLPQLQQQFPNSGSVIFLEALLTSDGEAAVVLYRKVIALHPNSPYADDAMLKIGEYLYARGLYIKAAQQLKQIPVHYPRSDLIYPSIRLFLNAMLVTGNRDTARFYAQVFARKYPDITFDLKAGRATSLPGKIKQGPAQAGAAALPSAGNNGFKPASGKEVARLQLGAFRDRSNARKLIRQLESLNYNVRIDKRRSGGRNLYVVMAVGFVSETNARLAGQLLKENYGIDYLVVKAP